MELDLTDAVEADTDPLLLWGRMLEASAVGGFLGGHATDVRALDCSGAAPADGHTFRIKGVGGGVYHARIDQRTEHAMVSYVVWSEKTPEVTILLTYAIDDCDGRTVLSGAVSMDMPLEEVLDSFGALGLIMKPIASGFAKRYMLRQLRKQLLAMASRPGASQDGRSTP